jgi:hypothetical protein
MSDNILILMAVEFQKKPVCWYYFIPFGHNPLSVRLKFTYLLMQLLDLGLTLLAMNIGLRELNPFINGMLDSPFKLIMVKFLIPLLIAWLVPGKLLIPGILLLFAVLTWNVHGLLSFVL